MQRYWAQSGDWNDQGQWVPGTYRLTIEASDLSAATAEVDRRLAEGDHRCFDCGSAVRVFNDRESSWRTLQDIDATWEFVARIGWLASGDGWRRRTTPPMTLDPPCR